MKPGKSPRLAKLISEGIVQARGLLDYVNLTAELPANLAFGGADNKTLYLTARTGLYRIRLKIPGIPSPGNS